jgi:hypothetical protein
VPTPRAAEQRPYSGIELNELCMIMLQALYSYNFIVRSEGAVEQALSTHELEIVRWTAQGKTSIEIGH